MNLDTRERFLRLLVQTGVLTDAECAQLQTSAGSALPNILAESYHCLAHQVLPILAEIFRTPSIDVRQESIAPDVNKLVPIDVCRKACALPLRMEDDKLLIAFADPEDLMCIDSVHAIAGCALEVRVGWEPDILAQLRLKEEEGKSVSELLDAIIHDDAPAELTPRQMAEPAEVAKPGRKADASAVPKQLLERWLGLAVTHDAEHLYLIPLANGKVNVRLRCPGEPIRTEDYCATLHPAVAEHMKALLRRQALQGIGRNSSLRLKKGVKTALFDVLITPGKSGDAIMLYRIPEQSVLVPLQNREHACICTHCQEVLQARWKFCPICGQAKG